MAHEFSLALHEFNACVVLFLLLDRMRVFNCLRCTQVAHRRVRFKVTFVFCSGQIGLVCMESRGDITR